MQQAASADGVPGVLGQAANGTPAWFVELQRSGARAAALQSEYLEKQSRLWSALVAGRSESIVSPQSGDRRFSAAQWRDNAYFDYLRQSYLLASRFIEDLVDAAELEGRAKERLRFAARQWMDALSPANFAATNPQFLDHALETRGESVAKGLANLLGDVHKGRISHTDDAAFELGRNLATTPGAVVYENELVQVIQYAAVTPEVHSRPLVMVPPCINKFYILDLQADNSLVRYAIEHGHTVFMVSWRNIGPELGHLTWDDYLEKGVFQALRVAREITGADKVNALGFCVGGTLLGAALAVLAAKGEEAAASVTFLTTMLDFAEAGPLGVFIDEVSVAAREAAIARGGVMSGKELDFVFSSLRPNDLVWPYVVHNYLLGQRPPAFDLLHWNADGANLPGPMFCYYLRNTYLENRLREPNALMNCGVPVDLRRISAPAFVFSTREDHIVPWRSAYRTTGLVAGERTFVLGAAGHIAGVVNPPARKRRSHWVGEDLPEDPQAWLSGAREESGSWWPRWIEWLGRHAGGKVKAPREPGDVQHRAIEPAPGRYVRQRIH